MVGFSLRGGGPCGLRHERLELTHDVHLLAQAMATLLAAAAARRSAAAQACRVPRLMPRVLVADVLALLREALSESERMACVAAHDASCVSFTISRLRPPTRKRS